MRSKKVLRHYCEHCNKSLGRRDAMVRHEETCYKNLDRNCCICDQNTPLRAMLVKCEIGSNYNLETLDAECDGCPACMLAFIVVTNMPQYSEFYEIDFNDFNYQAELKKYNIEATSQGIIY